MNETLESIVRRRVREQIDAILTESFDVDAVNVAGNDPPELNYREQLETARRTALLRALKESEGNKAEAARLLGVSRGRIYKLAASLGVPIATRRRKVAVLCGN